MSVTDVLEPWAALNNALGLAAPIRDERHYEELLAFVEECFDRFGGDDAHPIFGLVAIVSDRIREYEARAHPWPDTATAADVIALLMEEHGLRQSDLSEIGPQSVVSEVLSGRRKLNLRQVKALAARFHVPMEVLAG
ncbi:MAG: transcriptional regulator [Betaproteobacteria bacterium]|nr:transcriptional regulator [Betaproteobacteria bacterium]